MLPKDYSGDENLEKILFERGVKRPMSEVRATMMRDIWRLDFISPSKTIVSFRQACVTGIIPYAKRCDYHAVFNKPHRFLSAQTPPPQSPKNLIFLFS